MQKYKDLMAVVILSENGTPPRKTIDAADKFDRVYLVFPPDANPDDYKNVTNIPASESIPKVLNKVLHECECEFLCVLNENVELDSITTKLLESVPDEQGFIYGDYLEIEGSNETPKKSYYGPEDITERADLGPLAIYRTEILQGFGGWDESLKFAFDYDLRLKLGESHGSFYIPETLCRMTIFKQVDSAAQKLFFPGKGKYGGFSYLFMEPEEEKEIENVFAKSLKRRVAYLEGEASPYKNGPRTSPLVTVITPVYNREKFIGKTIESVLSGDFQDFEYIIIDNGSTDNTVKTIERYMKDSRIKLIKNPVNRIAISLNIGLQNARGKYISQLDSDDLYTHSTLRTMSSYMEETNCGLAISYYSLIDEEGNDLPEFGVIKHLEYSRNNIMRVDGAGAVRMWRKSAMLEFGGFDAEKLVDYGEDYDLVLKMGEKYKIGRVHEVLYKYRRHPDNSDILRDPMFKLRNKNLARERAIIRRRKMNIS